MPRLTALDSHVFCIDCSNQCQLSGQQHGQHRSCPACEAPLPNPDDVVITNLNPTEDYKTSVLSGLSPHIIMECSGRALGFWAYQTTTEIVYQEYLAKNLGDKFSTLSTQMDKLIHDANSEISNLKNKLANIQVDQDTLRRRNEELNQAFREKSRKQMQTQELYDKLKRKAMLSQVQEAALDAVDHTVQASAIGNRFVDRVGNQPQNQPQPQRQPAPLFSNQPSGAMQRPGMIGGGGTTMGPPITQPRPGENAWAGFSSQGSSQQNPPMQTPSTHRQPLAPGNVPTPRQGPSNLRPNSVPGLPGPQQRPPLSGLNVNRASPRGFAGYGMSAGLKVSNPAGAAPGEPRPWMSSRVAQRPPSRSPAFGPSATPNMFSNGDRYF
ncbi:related to lactose regulatory protein [Phialocephala subalpina]|uniref:Related to lactose regulatory protein n=1 Tax=Phialocephala subalpina TaxID=576137 RepID=A0A1L7XDY7_9HELO|nr:related to lactose regulatory protein [Phialocephala subalpina]